ncbi:MAG: hypothetical protein GY928_08255 [Colwellia sp.]|nr:hypothetical protein [Colwellia sp.]
MKEEKKPFYKSVKKTLGVIGFIFYWAVQIPAVFEDPKVAVDLAFENALFVCLLLGIKTAGGIIASKKDKE